MRKYCLTLVALLVAFATARSAHASATDYTITFSGGGAGALTPIGTFDYDPTVGLSNFNVVFDGTTFDLTSSANAPGIFDSPPCIGGNTGAQATFLLLTSCASDPLTEWQGTNAYLCCGFADFRFFWESSATDAIVIDSLVSGSNNSGNITESGSFATNVTPEPGTAVLWLTGIGLMILTRKRLAVC